MLFESNRLEYRLFVETDAEKLKTFWGNEEVMAYCGGVSNPSTERFLRTIAFYKDLYIKEGYTVFAVIEKKSKSLIGAAGFNPTDNAEEIELIYHFSKTAWGKGYGSEACAACLSQASSLSSIKSIIASVDKRNKASKRILENNNFIYQGLKWFEDTGQEEHCFYYPLT